MSPRCVQVSAAILQKSGEPFVASFPSNGEECKWVLLWGADPAGLILPDLPFHFLLDKIGRGLVYRFYNELSWKITSQGVRGREEGFYVDGRRNG